jgi:ComF family protein
MEIVRQLIAAIMPGSCLLCGTGVAVKERLLCAGCAADLPHSGSACYVCGAALPRDLVCGSCLARPPAFDHVVSAYAYRYPVDQLVKNLKYRQQLAVARPLAQGLVQRIRQEGEPLPDCLLPVPLHPLRLVRRGYNQALEIAREVGRGLNIAVADDVVRRQRSTREQARLPLPARRRNLRRAFALRRPLQQRHIAIVDDVMTSGATVGELARLLRRVGVETVHVWVLARTQQ